jgi:hypothetical protein
MDPSMPPTHCRILHQCRCLREHARGARGPTSSAEMKRRAQALLPALAIATSPALRAALHAASAPVRHHILAASGG